MARRSFDGSPGGCSPAGATRTGTAWMAPSSPESLVMAIGHHILRRVAGVSAILAGLCQVAWFVMNAVTGGVPDSGHVRHRTGSALIVAWNLLLIPVAVHLGRHLGPVRPALVR